MWRPGVLCANCWLFTSVHFPVNCCTLSMLIAHHVAAPYRDFFFFFFWFEYPIPTSWKPKSWNFWRVAKKKKTLVKFVCATWLHIIWFPNSKPKSVCLRENTALGLHPPQRVPVSERPSKQSLSYDIIPNERFCVFSRVLIWAILKPPLANVWDEKTAVVDQQRYHNVNVSGSRKKSKPKPPRLP